MTKRQQLLICLALLTSLSVAQATGRYELVLNGGTVMDPESGLQAVRNVAVSDGKIVAISEAPLKGVKTIDARGRVVAPGFIDLHSHSQNLVGSRVQAFDGVTTAMENEVGQLPVAMAYDKANAVGRAINYGFSASWSLARLQVMGGATPDGLVQGISNALEKADAKASGRATDEQVKEILRLLEQGLNEGASGIGLALGYLPGAGEDEIFKVSQLAARYGVTVFVHMRGTYAQIASLQEVVANAAMTGAHWHIMHVYVDNAPVLEAVELSQKAGVSITPETLSWLSGSTYIGATFLRPDALRKSGRSPQDILYYGKPIESFERLEDIQRTDPKAHIITLNPNDDEKSLQRRNEIAKRLRSQGWVLASDAMPWQQFPTAYLPEKTWPLPAAAWAHPRGAASYTRIIQKYVQEWKLATLMDVLKVGSLNPARELESSIPQFRGKGRIKVGADADLIVFDPARVEAVATVKQPAAVSRGMDYVLVNGRLIIENGKLDAKSFPGAAVRRSVHH